METASAGSLAPPRRRYRQRKPAKPVPPQNLAENRAAPRRNRGIGVLLSPVETCRHTSMRRESRADLAVPLRSVSVRSPAGGLESREGTPRRGKSRLPRAIVVKADQRGRNLHRHA